VLGAGAAGVAAAAVGIALLVVWALNYGERTVTVAGNRIGCVYSSATSGGHFERAIAPGAQARVSNSAQVVRLPTGEQTFDVSTSASRSQGAPSRVLAFTKAQTAVWVEGVLKYRFNTENARACRWYSKYGLQTLRWSAVVAQAHADTLRQVVHDGSSAWTWQQLAYGSDPAVKTVRTTEPISVGYGKHIGAMFTKYLGLNLGDRYFCGVQPGLSGLGEVGGCPPMYFQILSVYPRDEALAAEHEKLKQLDAALARQRQAAKLKAMNRSVAIASARAQRKVLLAQIVNTRLDAQNDVKVQKCLILARVGLDCDGHKETVIVAGGTTKK
jgi:regulator of protease activity HflC (stomatin/prohibitin superfamily)